MPRTPPALAQAARMRSALAVVRDRKSTRLNSSHTVIYTLSLHDALPISHFLHGWLVTPLMADAEDAAGLGAGRQNAFRAGGGERSEEHTSELQSHRDLHSFPTRRSSDLAFPPWLARNAAHGRCRGRRRPWRRPPECVPRWRW